MTDPYINPKVTLTQEAEQLHRAIAALSRKLDTRIIALSTLLFFIVLCCVGMIGMAFYNRSVNSCQERHNNAVHDAWVRQINEQTRLFSVVANSQTSAEDRYRATMAYQRYLQDNPVPPADC